MNREPLKAKIPIDQGSVVKEKLQKVTDALDEKKKAVEASASEGKKQIQADDTSSNSLTKEKNKKKEAYKITAEDLTGYYSLSLLVISENRIIDSTSCTCVD